MVGTRADNSDVDSVTLIPTSIAIDDVDSIPCVQVINSTFSVNFPYLDKRHMSVIV